MGKPEGKIEDYLGKQAKKYGFMYLKFTSPANSGVPDRCLIGHGMTIFVELKRPKGKPRALQQAVFRDMRQHGGVVYVVDTKSKADALLKQLVPDFKEPVKHKPKKKIGSFRVMSIDS